MADPVSWLQIEQGWGVVTSDGVTIGKVAQVQGDKESDIFGGLAVEAAEGKQLFYVPGEQVGPIYPGQVILEVASTGSATFEPFVPSPPETKWLPEKPSLAARISSWLRGGR
jgi:hypothetical protein